MWWCALGPDPKVGGEASEVPGPFAVLMQAPGFSSLRVPGRFWLMGTLSMSMVVAYVVAAMLHARQAAVSVLGRRGAVAGRAGRRLGGAHADRGRAARAAESRRCSAGRWCCTCRREHRRCVPTYYGVEHGWRSVNGYSGFEPNHYDGVRQASKFELEGLFTAFTESADLHVVVAADAPRMRELVARQPGVRTTGTSATATQYLVPSRSRTVAMPRGTPAPVAEVRSSCPPANILVGPEPRGDLDVRAAGGHRNHHVDLGGGHAGDRCPPDTGPAGGIPASSC